MSAKPKPPAAKPDKVLLKDIVIPAGTIFRSCDGTTRRYSNGNYEVLIGLSKDSSGSLTYGIEPENSDFFADAVPVVHIR